MVAVPAMQPSHDDRSAAAAGGGTIWATGTPLLVTSTGSPVRRTSSSTARQVALNVEMAR